MEDPEAVYGDGMDSQKDIQTLSLVPNNNKKFSKNFPKTRTQIVLMVAVAILAILSIVFVAMYLTIERTACKRHANVANTSNDAEKKCKPCVCQAIQPVELCKKVNKQENYTDRPIEPVRFKEVDEQGNCTHQPIQPTKCNGENEETNNTYRLLKSTDCAELYKKGAKLDGVYTIDPDGFGAFNVRCDMTTSGGGWTIFQRRIDGSVGFYRRWNSYKNGFGTLYNEFWLGLDKINRLTESGQMVLRVDMEDFENETRYAEYSTFTVSNEADNYKLTFGQYSGNANDSLAYSNGMEFSTRDMDNDQWSWNCAQQFKGAWWYNKCHQANLNGQYLRGTHTSRADGVNWYHWKKFYYSLKKTQMKVRPHSF